MGDSDTSTKAAAGATGATGAIVLGPRFKAVLISEVENGYIVQEQLYPRRQFIADNATRACDLARGVIAPAA